MARSQQANEEIQNTESVLGLKIDISNPTRPTMVEAKGERAKELQRRAMELAEMMRSIGVRPATVFSMRPLAVHAQGTHSSNYPIAPCVIGKRFEKVLIPTYEVAVTTTKNGEEEPKPVLPIDIAGDIKAQANKNGMYGILVYLGDINPDRKMDPRDADMRDVLKDLEAEKELMVQEFLGYVQAAETAYTSKDQGRGVITEKHRMAARYLLHERILTKQPNWLLESRASEDVPEPCFNCKAEPAKGALQCQKCFNWIKPFEGFKAGAFGLDDPNGVVALRRLTRAQLEELGIYPAIKPHAEHTADLLAAAKKKQQ